MNSYFTRAMARASGTSRITPIAAARFAPAPFFAEAHDEPRDAAGLERPVPPAVRPASAQDVGSNPIAVAPGPDTAEPRAPSSLRGVTVRAEGRVAGDDSPVPSTTAPKPAIGRARPEGEPPPATAEPAVRVPRSPAVDVRPGPRTPEQPRRHEAVDSSLLMPASVRPLPVSAGQAIDSHGSLDARRGTTNALRVASSDRWRDGRDSARDDVHITIGRLEVTAVHAPAPTRRAPSVPTDPAMSLDQYLARRRGGR